jgi:pimeloyl-ACP methyl ester carboxylesterase
LSIAGVRVLGEESAEQRDFLMQLPDRQVGAVPGSGTPIFQAAAANLNPWTEARVELDNPERGPLLIISGERDHTVPWAIANASYLQQLDNPGVTEIVEIPGRGHSLTIDGGWREVADTALTFLRRFV